MVEVASYKWSKVEFRLHFRFERGCVAQCAHQLEWIVVWHKWSCILVECVAVDISGTCSTKCTAGNCSKCPPPPPFPLYLLSERDWGKVSHSLLVIHLFVLTILANFIIPVTIIFISCALSSHISRPRTQSHPNAHCSTLKSLQLRMKHK